MKPYERAVRCADEANAENDPQRTDESQKQTGSREQAGGPVQAGNREQAGGTGQKGRRGLVGGREPEERPAQAGGWEQAGGTEQKERRGFVGGRALQERRRADTHPQVNLRRKSHRRAEMAAPRTVTQITPDDILAEEGPIAPARADGAVSEEQIEEDVAIINPSADSMDSRG